MTPEMTLMHLMCAKICHDLAAPASAVSMGLEMFLESPQDTITSNLMTISTQALISKLELFRCLTGFSTLKDKPTGIDLEKILKNYWPDNKIRVVWEVSHLENLQGPLARLVLATILTAADGLPRGGTLTVNGNLSISAEGPSAQLREEAFQALSGRTSPSQQSTRTIIPFFAYTLAKNMGGKFQIQAYDKDQFQIQITE